MGEKKSRELLRGCGGHGRLGQDWEALGFTASAANLDFFKEQGRRDDGGRQAALVGAERAEGRARDTGYLALHVVVDEIVIADARDITQEAGAETADASAADELLSAIFGMNFVDHERETIGGRIAAKTGEQIGEVLLVHEADGRVIHLTKH